MSETRADARGWGRGWPSCEARSQIVVVVCGANRVRLPVHRRIAPLVAALVRDLEAARGIGFNPSWSWGYACRSIAGSTTPSNHSWGLAVDLDAPTNPRRSPLVTNMPAATPAIAARYGFRWGGAYQHATPDPMHFEFMGTPADADARVAALGHTPAPSRPAPKPKPLPPKQNHPALHWEDEEMETKLVEVDTDGGGNGYEDWTPKRAARAVVAAVANGSDPAAHKAYAAATKNLTLSALLVGGSVRTVVQNGPKSSRVGVWVSVA